MRMPDGRHSRTKLVSVRMTPAAVAKMDRMCARHGVERSAWIRHIITRELQAMGQEPVDS